MKGILFEKGVELQVETDQESWIQGDSITGQIRLGSDEKQTVVLKLIYSPIKTMQDENSWEVLGEQTLVCKNSASWSFQLAQNTPISDKKGTLFLTYSLENGRTSKLDLPVAPHFLISAFLQTFEKNFDFLSKQQKYHQGFFETKMMPPDSENFAKLDYVHCALSVANDVFHIHYKFRIQKFGRDQKDDQLKIIRETKTFQQKQELKDCLNSGYPKRPLLKKMIEEAFQTSAPQGWQKN